LERLEEQGQQTSNEVDNLSKQLNALDTYLTGHGVQGSVGKLGDIAQSLTDISTGMRTMHDEIKTEMIELINEQIAKARWRTMISSGKAFWAIIVFMVSVAAVIVTIVTRHT
jgi:hypothetical protein